jgi:hypothetical protein
MGGQLSPDGRWISFIAPRAIELRRGSADMGVTCRPSTPPPARPTGR